VIILDTNVLSELMKASPAESVIGWVATQAPSSLYITSVTQAEILHGVLLMPSGKKRDAIHAASEAMFASEFNGRILSFDSPAAACYARIAADRRRKGHPISQLDAQIAAIALAARAAIATRNVADFAGCGVTIVNPWGP
jgi:predicted nucleic acid-binding protein